ncbi:sensor histidine kinase [Leucothrix arctica]|uniref:histidine kinase n=1 Tax=Leucothrix arctica TaxID=1481894 RepID=A0A317CCI7_9GAMM|nr:ATP-binding protein [Leucothrix arctica]PWQ93802.1 hypothetical protein DKT75_19555 [Leucothrix arctica]
MFFFSKIKKSLLIKSVLTAVLIVSIVFAILVPRAFKLLDSIVEEQIRHHSSELAGVIDSAVRASLLSRDPKLGNKALNRLLKQPALSLRYALVYDNKGSLFAQAGLVNPALIPAKDTSLTQTQQDGIYDDHHILKLESLIIGSVEYGFSVDNELRFRSKLRRQGTIVTMSALLATAAFFGLFGLSITRQLKKLIIGTHAIAAGDYTNKVNVSSKDEIGQLSSDFNSMIDAIRDKTDTIDESKRFLEGITDNIEGMIYRYNNSQQWNLRYVSAGAEKLTGYSSQELISNDGFDFSAFIFQEDRQLVWDAIQYSVSNQQGFSINYRILTRKGEVKWVLDRGRQIKTDESQIEGIIIDISSQKQAEIEQKKAEQQSRQYLGQLAQLNRVNTLGEMTAGIAHEINQPLSSIVTRSGAARRRLASLTPDMKKVDSALKAISEQALRAGNVIQRMRDLVSVQKSERDSVYPNELLKEALKIIKIDGAWFDNSIETKFSPDLPPVLVDKIQIQQVVLNLLRNAQDAMHLLPPDERIIILRSTQLDDDFVQISIIDQGVGIDFETESELLNAFFTTKKTGMGMGLSICRTIMTAHEGQLWFSRNDNKGVSFHITLPIVHEKNNDGGNK